MHTHTHTIKSVDCRYGRRRIGGGQRSCGRPGGRQRGGARRLRGGARRCSARATMFLTSSRPEASSSTEDRPRSAGARLKNTTHLLTRNGNVT